MTSCDCQKTVTAVIVGAGHRSLCYAEYAVKHPERLKIVGIAEPDDFRRNQVAKKFDIASEFCFSSAEKLADQSAFADVAINGTMDKDHVPTSLALLKVGYHILLEKPIGISKEEVLTLLKAVRDTKKKVMICHVLRYAPFYVEIKKRIASGELGLILNIQTAEHVSYHHTSVAFVRGKWNREDVCLSSMLMAKCCHDLDLIMWFKAGIRPQWVSSLGGRSYFNKQHAPQNSGTRCLVDCSIENDCIYSAKKLYIDHPDRWSMYVWDKLESVNNLTMEQKIESLKTDNPQGKCIWKMDNNVVDHQSVMIQFADGSTATHNMVGGTSESCRKIHLVGTKGEIYGRMEDGYFFIARPDPRPGHETAIEKVNLNISNDMHGGGDLKLVEDFLNVVRGQSNSISTTDLEDSFYGHMVGFEADRAMMEHAVIKLEEV